ncbi:Serine/threonine-protein kinase PknB [Streptomyces sp. RB5]|uniref:non-specific serine/threonine protein kinase n=1 Tax=Streptomyces smaragdinus TaxID=2585196 RepID=A0A7K0CGU8_9ACTN|nr:Stk1 family PASTA domain-containing Ser/Thr kinase [Streptomyces smaragdinus]MQY12705.1 Serine/threonine-protein kinase PknB [Streptomyces smaragdinus]
MDEPRRLGGRYELGQVLGRGGMAEVYLAHDTRLGRTVAVKTLRADMARDPSFQARFRREAQSAASLNHPAIVAVYDTGEDYIDNVSIPYIVMEYVDGSTLRELLHSGRRLMPERAMEMCVGILQALEYSHRSQIVHRDIKPANVMLTRTGQVKVMDFGIARAMGDSGMTMTQTAAVIGTAQYLSPEQAKGEQVDARSDLYSTGCLLYELLTNRPPFVGDSPVAVAYQHVREEPQPPSVYDPEITPEMDAIVLKALTKDRDYRYQSADEMRADIEACLDGQPVAATASMGAVGGYGGYGADVPTTALTAQPGPYGQPTSMLPPMRDDDGGMGYDDGPPGRRRQPPPRRNGSTSTVLLVLAGILVLVGAIFIGKSIFSNSPNNTKEAPNVLALTKAQAQNRITNSGLKYEEGEGKSCKPDKKGTVLEQSPAPKEPVAEGDTVTVVVCTSVAEVEVPDVTGKDFDDARSELEDAGFEVKRKNTPSEDEDPGTVLSQDPDSGKLAPGETVTLEVAAEPAAVQIPDVTGLRYDQAVETLKGQGFNNIVQRIEPNDTQPEGSVFKTDPAALTPAKKDQQITVYVAAKKDDKVQIPQITGQNLAAARAALTGLGLGLEPVSANGQPPEDNWLVQGVMPPHQEGGEARKGETVRVMVAPPGGP